MTGVEKLCYGWKKEIINYYWFSFFTKITFSGKELF